jgi:ribonuclease BN (tRNA processing enzyme)
VRLTVVGSSGSFPGPGNPASCYLVEAGGTRVVLDLGNGALGPLATYVDLDDVDAVLLSHLHADHCLDMCSYYVYRRYHPDGPRPRLPVYGPAETADRLARAYDLAVEPGMREEFDFFEWRERGSYEVGALRVTVTQMVHPVTCYAMRIEHAGAALVYSGDTGASAALVEAARGADLLLAEASFHEGRDHVPGLHLTGREAGEHAAKAGVGRLVLTHLPPWNDPERSLAEAREAWTGPLEVARPGAVYEL